MTLFDYIDREGAIEQWLALIDGDIETGIPLVTSGELHGRTSQYLQDKKQHKTYYHEHACYVGYVAAQINLSMYRTHPAARSLHKLISATPTYVYTLAFVAENKRPDVSGWLLNELRALAEQRPKLFMINRTALMDVVADAYITAWYKQDTCQQVQALLTLLRHRLCFTRVQQRNFDKRIYREGGDLSRWYQHEREKAVIKQQVIL